MNTVRPRRKPYRSSTIKRVNVNNVRPNGNHIEAVLSSEVNVNTVRPQRKGFLLFRWCWVVRERKNFAHNNNEEKYE